MAKKQLQGVDATIEIALKEYGFAWIQGDTETFFIYGAKGNDEGEYSEFNYAYYSNELDVREEFDWVDWDGVMTFEGITNPEWDAQSLTQKLYSLYRYYGSEEIFGESFGYSYRQARFWANSVKVA